MLGMKQQPVWRDQSHLGLKAEPEGWAHRPGLPSAVTRVWGGVFFSFFFRLFWILVAVQIFSSCRTGASHCSGFSRCGAQALGTRASVAAVHGL